MNHDDIFEEVSRAFKQPVMANVHRSEYVEAMVYLALRDSGWKRMTVWDSWDIENDSGVRLEVKQAAAAQAWDRMADSSPRFDIAARTRFWDGTQEVYEHGRHAHIYVFAWHGELGEAADQRDPNTWEFYVVRENALPDQKTIGLPALSHLASPCRIDHLSMQVLQFM